MPSSINVAVIDDHSLMRNAIISSIHNFENIQVTIEGSDGNELIKEIQQNGIPDLILLDLNMPGMDGFETIKWLNSFYPNVSIIVLSAFTTDKITMKLISMGVNCILTKNIEIEELRHAIRTVLNDGCYYPNGISNKLLAFIRLISVDSKEADKYIFTEKETTFLKLASTEKTYKEIATEMNISTKSVDKIREDLFLRHNIKCRAGLVRLAIEAGINFHYN